MLALAPSPQRGFGRLLLVAALPCLTALVFAPATIYFTNRLEFPRRFVELLPLLVAIALGTALLLAGVLRVLPAGNVCDAAIALVCAVGVLAWVQGSLLLWNYGTLAGQEIDWAAHRTHGWIDAAVWAIGVAAALAAFRAVSRTSVAISVTLIAIQTIALSILSARSQDVWFNHVTFDDSARFALSRDRNVVIVLLDTFQSDVFQEVLDQEPGLTARLSGFTYFRNATSGFPSTLASMTFLLTGQQYDNSVPFRPFVKRAFTTASVPKSLKSAGYDVYYNNSAFWSTVYADATLSSHLGPKALAPFDATSTFLAQRVARLGLFRSVPQFGKQMLGATAAVAPRSAVAATGDPGEMPFFKTMSAQATATAAAPVFRYYHLWGLHPPIAHDEELRPTTAPYTRENAVRQARGVLRLMDSFLATLVRLKVYDRTLLIVVGDHGSAFPVRLTDVAPGSRAATGPPAATTHPFALPLVLIKPFSASGPMQISDAPVSLGDVPRTIMSALGLPNSFPGQSILDTRRSTDTSRRVFWYNPGLLRQANAFFPLLTEFSVSGHSWLDESWRQTGRIFSPGEVRVEGSESFAWGQRLVFAVGGNAGTHLAGGWSNPEAAFTWTVGHESRLRFRGSPAQDDLHLMLRLRPYLSPSVPRQRVTVLVRDQIVGEWEVTTSGKYSVVIPKSLVSDGVLELRFLLPDAAVPTNRKVEVTDARHLALAVYWGTLSEGAATDARVDDNATVTR